MRATVFLLAFLAAGPAFAGPATLLSKADPARPSGSAGGWSAVHGISADGRYVVFVSEAANLLAGVDDTNDDWDVFLHDSVAGTTTLVSHAAGDPFAAADAGSGFAVLSADGRYVAFLSYAADLVAGQFGAVGNVFLYDRVTGGTALVSHLPGQATWATGQSWSRLEISADGGRVVYDSFASNLVAGQSDNSFSVDLFLYDRAAGTNTLVSHTSASATTAAGGVGDASISADGGRVAFLSDATNLVAGQTDANGTLDAFLYDAATGAVSLVSHAAGSAVTAANAGTYDVKISADGAWVGIRSLATNLIAGQSDANNGYDVFLHERASGTNTLASRVPGSAATAGNGSCWAFSFSADGRYTAFSSDSSDLTANDASATTDIFLFDRVAATTTLVSRSAYQNSPAGGYSTSPEISADGAWVAFTSTASNLIVGQTGPDASSQAGIFLWQRASNAVTIVSHADGSATSVANGLSQEPFRLSANAGRIALASFASNLDSGIDDANADSDVFLFDRASGGNTLLSVRDGAVSQTAGSTFFVAPPGLSNDGRYTAFTSAAPNLIPGQVDENNGGDIFLHDRVAGTLTLVSRSLASPSQAGDLRSRSPVMSTDGSTIVFFSLARDLVPGQVTTFGFGHLFVYDRASGALSLVDHAAGSPATTTDASPAGLGEFTLSGDGRWIAFSSFGTDLIAGQTEGSGGADVFLRDRLTGQTTLVSHAASLPAQTGNGSSTNPVISGDGRYVAFQSSATDLVAPGGTGGLFLYDRVAGTTVKASPSGYAINLSGDGRWLLFASDATNLVPGQVDTNGSADLFLWDRVAGSTVLVSRAASSPTTTVTGGAGPGPFDRGRSLLSVDGRWVVFSSRGTNLVTGFTDTNSVDDIFLYDRVAGTVSLVSRSAYYAATGSARSAEPAISADGRWITFRSQAPDLVPSQMETGSSYDDDFFLHDRTAGTTSLVSHTPGSELTAAGATYGFLELARPSADGAWVVFEHPGEGLAAGDLDGQADTFLHANPLPGRDFFTVAPCRVLDTQTLTSGVERTVTVAGISGACGIPATARAIAVNVTVLEPSNRGRLTLHPGDLAAPLTSTINFAAGETRANNALLALALDGTGTLSLTPFVTGGGTVQAILDVTGYFE